MQIMSLNEMESHSTHVAADICIVGAGAAGLYLANRLEQFRGRVVVLEAGSHRSASGSELGFKCTFPSETYRGATEGRSFGLGGTTSVWGGQLISFQPSDADREDPAIRRSWQKILGIIAEHKREVAQALGVADLADESTPTQASYANTVSSFQTVGLSPLLSCWLPFTKRNFSRLARASRSRAAAASVYCDAVAAQWRLGPVNVDSCRIQELVARSQSGRELRVCAKQYVVAAGAIESTRILLEMDAAGGNNVVPAAAELGRYLSDHLSFRVARLESQATVRAVRAFGPRFSKGAMRSWRFVERTPSPASCRYFAHALFPLDNAGFLLARSILQGVQARKVPVIGLKELAAGSIGAINLAWWRLIRSRLYVPDNSPCNLQIDMEQRRNFQNSISLDENLDRFGRPIGRIDWRLSSEDEADMATSKDKFLSRWTSLRPPIAIQPVTDEIATQLKPHDAYHPVGVCRFGDDSEAVVDLHLKLRGTDNVFVLSTGLFPSAGSANPTFALLCFAERLATDLEKGLHV